MIHLERKFLIMQIKTSYYYQIRNFKPYMIPVSTSLGDPLWFHDGKGNDYIYEDKRGILNGVRYLYIMEQWRCKGCPCKDKNPEKCDFLRQYKIALEDLDFNKVINDLNWLANEYQKKKGFKEEPIIVLMFHEAWYNKCSERATLQEYFNKHGIKCKELEYPI